ncbi:MAG TPA: MFS transporter [Dehalococcoidia bacterium]|nr:MFS transporter [Dehalococcoidia bacterium]
MAGLFRRYGIFYGWWIVFCAAAIVFLSAGTFFYGFGLLVGPLTAEFGWSRAAVSIGFSLRTEVGGVAAPLVGVLVDRVGVRRLTTVGIVIVAIGFVMLSRVHSLPAFYVSIFIIAVGMSATGGANAATIIAQWFRRYRGKALGLMTFGGGLGGLSAIVFAELIAEFGWRDALVAVAVLQVAICVPLALSIRDRPEDMGLPVDGISEDDEAAAAAGRRAVPTTGLELTGREALRSVLFWKVALTFALSNFATTAIIVHQIPFLVEEVGSTEAFAALSVTIMTGISLAGRLGFGLAADRYSKALLAATAMACSAVGLALFSTVHHEWQLIYVLPFFGIGFGAAVPLRAAIQAEYFGLKAYGTTQGMLFTASTLGAFFGPLLAGVLYDATADYRPSFLILAIGPAIALPLILSTRGVSKPPATAAV